jgi:hypothetical protein
MQPWDEPIKKSTERYGKSGPLNPEDDPNYRRKKVAELTAEINNLERYFKTPRSVKTDIAGRINPFDAPIINHKRLESLRMQRDRLNY